MGLIVLQLHGVPGSGKSTLARELAPRLGAVVLDKDVPKSELLDGGMPEEEAGPRAYDLHFDAARQLVGSGRSVILDGPAFWPEVEQRARSLAEQADARFLLVECVCADVLEVRRRLARRAARSSQPRRPHRLLPAGAAGPTSPRLAVDTSRPASELAAEIVRFLEVPRSTLWLGSPGEDEWPAWATEPVEVVPHRAEWSAAARAEAAALERVLEPWLAAGVEHVGSTAIPGMPAKPILDLLAGVHDLGAAAEADEPLAAVGYELVPPALDARPWRRSYVRPRDGRRYAHLHLTEPGHVRWRHLLAFRDHLRADARAAHRYAEAKLELARRHGTARETYSHAKTELVADVLAEATAAAGARSDRGADRVP